MQQEVGKDRDHYERDRDKCEQGGGGPDEWLDPGVHVQDGVLAPRPREGPKVIAKSAKRPKFGRSGQCHTQQRPDPERNGGRSDADRELPEPGA